MKGTKGAIWQGLTVVVVLALILGAFPLAPTASGAVGVTRGEPQHLSGPGDGPAVTPGDGSSRETPLFMVLDAPITSNVNYPTNTSRWFFFNYDGSQTISVELSGDPAFSMNVFRGSNLYQEPGGSFVRFFTLQGALNSGEYFFQVQGGSSAAQSFTIVARAGAGGGTLGDSRGSPDVMSGPLPVSRDIATSSVPSKWFSRNFLGIQDLDIIVGTPDTNVQLWVYYGSSPYPLPQSDGRKVFRVGMGSPVGDYLFEVRNVQAVSFNITLSGPMAAGACSLATPCPLNMDMPFKSNVGPNSSQWFQHNHADTSRRIGVELRSPSGSLSMNVRQGGTANPPVATNVRTYPLGEMANNWYFEVTGGFGGGDFEIVVPSQAAGTQMGPGGGPDRWSAAGLGMGDFRTGQLGSQQGTWFRFG
ncbi:MAG TPA: hypothetical protein VJA25_06305, partial [Dehalococcoidia bacterium]|nr:hypothetical protein [Dehalococcoidia bacterium]